MAKIRTSDIFLLALSNFVFATGWSAIKHPQDQMGPVVLNLWTLGLSIPVLLPFAIAEYRARTTPSPPLSLRLAWHYFAMGVFGLTGMTLLYNLGARLSLAANGALIAMCVPVMTALIAAIVLGERLTKGKGLSLLTAIVGVLIISDLDWNTVGFFGPYLSGNILLLAGAVGNAVYVVYAKKLLMHTGPMVVLFWGQVFGFAGSIPFLLVEPTGGQGPLAYTGTTWLSLVFLGSVYFGLTMVVFCRILDRMEAGKIMVFAYLQPVFGVAMSALLLGERITFSMVIGGLLVVAGTSLVLREEHTSSEPAGAVAARDL